MLTTFTKATSAASDFFGLSAAAVGNDRVLIGAIGVDAGASAAGSTYLFSTNGALLATFVEPTPSNGDFFGWSVAAVGIDEVLIGARYGHAGAIQAGAAYLFSTNGALLTTFTNPSPASFDYFGLTVAAVGADRVLIGARQDDAGATNAGAAYLFSLQSSTLKAPLLSIILNAQQLSTISLSPKSLRADLGVASDDFWQMRQFKIGLARAAAIYSIGYFFTPQSWPRIFQAKSGLFLK